MWKQWKIFTGILLRKKYLVNGGIMKLRKYVLKIISLLQTADNPSYLRYRIHHYLQKTVRTADAAKIACRNKLFYKNAGVDLIWLNGYDGSFQCCHPDMAYWQNKYWLLATPYPYGMEEYENPCLFAGETISELFPVMNEPIAFPSKKGYGSHLSDPCLLAIQDQLYCFYRDTVERDGEIENIIFYRIYDTERKWSDARIVISSKKDGLLSPAVIAEKEGYFMYFVSSKEGKLKLHRGLLSDKFEMLTDEICKCGNCPENMDLWHIGISKESSGYKGLFLFRGKSNPGDFQLYSSAYDEVSTTWNIIKRIENPKKLDGIIKIPYKSCFIPNKGGILLSFRDIHSVYGLMVLDDKDEEAL